MIPSPAYLQRVRRSPPQKETGCICNNFIFEILVCFFNLRYISAHELLFTMGPDRSAPLPLFHAFTGCDTVSAFVGRGKKTCWEIWNKFPAVTAAFIALYSTPVAVPDSCLGTLERFFVMLYDTKSTCSIQSILHAGNFLHRKAKLLTTSHQLKMHWCNILDGLFIKLAMYGDKCSILHLPYHHPQTGDGCLLTMHGRHCA